MTARPANFSFARWAGVFVLILGIATGMWLGCSTPRERYETLSTFFDGVPSPYAATQVATTNPDSNVPVVYASVAIVSRHKPYIDATGNRDKCAVCHRSATGEIMEFEEAYRVCTQCHKKIGTEHVRMHGPVAVAGLPGVKPTCKWCHTGHESHEPALLKDSAVKVCTQCHESQLLSPTPQQHTDGTSCIQCHFGHGGDAQNAHFLKPGSVPQWPATQPATRPATQPATQPWAAGRVRRPAEEAPS